MCKTCDQMHVKIKGKQSFIEGMPFINKTESDYIDGPPVKNKVNSKETDGVPVTGIPVCFRTESCDMVARCSITKRMSILLPILVTMVVLI